jgi:predicted ATP-dependent endonuclease of OLD family
VGHGLQRAIILTVLEYVARRRSSPDEKDGSFEEPQSDIILAIEEPEIYQHPTKQRLFRNVLKDLSSSFSKQTGIRLQIICVTHSPLFVDIARCDEVRLLRKQHPPHPYVSVTSVTLEACSRFLGTYAGKPEAEHFTPNQLAARLHVFTPEIAEGFFAKKVVLVEGVSDKAMIEALFANLGRSCLAEGIVVANAGGKNNIDKLGIIFRELGIPTYIIIDNDQSDTGGTSDGRIAVNKILQQLSGVELDKCADWPDGIFTNYSAWDGNIEKIIKSITGSDSYIRVRQDCATEYGIKASDCEKSPTVATEMLKRFRAEGHAFGELEELILAIDAL